MNTSTYCIKILVPCDLIYKLNCLYTIALSTTKRMLINRNESSTKYYPELPSTVVKALIRKYQKNIKCQIINNLVIPLSGDKGRQIKNEKNGIRIPSLFGKKIIPVKFSYPINGFVRSIEFFQRKGVWYGSLCYNTLVESTVKTLGCIGIDRNSVGNIAVFADSQTGTVRKLGICPARTKATMRGRRKNLQKAGKFRLLSKLSRKQRRLLARLMLPLTQVLLPVQPSPQETL